jgi:PEP-CTERM motif
MRTVLLLVAPAASAMMATEAFAGSFTASYSFTGRPGDEASVPADNQPLGVTLSDLTRGPGISAAPGADSINSSGWTTGTSPDLANDFYQFTITPDPGVVMDLTSLTYMVQRSDAGPPSFEVRTSRNGFSAPIVPPAVDFLPADVTYINDINLSIFPEFQGLDSAVTFRIYAYHASSPDGTFQLNDGNLLNGPGVQLAGIASVPEPSSLVMAGIASLVGLWATRPNGRRRRP